MSSRGRRIAHTSLALMLALLGGCTLSHSKQALWSEVERAPHPKSRFVTEDDSGIALLGILRISEPDHYAVLLERIRTTHGCARLSHAQLDFYSDYWLLVSFPITRVTVLCEPPAAKGEGSDPVPPPPPASAATADDAEPVASSGGEQAPAPAEPAVTAAAPTDAPEGAAPPAPASTE